MMLSTIISVGRCLVPRNLDRARETSRVVGILQAQNIPVVSLEPCRDILAHREIGVAFDGHGVAVVDPAKI